MFPALKGRRGAVGGTVVGADPPVDTPDFRKTDCAVVAVPARPEGGSFIAPEPTTLGFCTGGLLVLFEVVSVL